MECNLKDLEEPSLLFKRLTSFNTLRAEYWTAVNRKVSLSSRSGEFKTKLPAWVDKSVKK